MNQNEKTFDQVELDREGVWLVTGGCGFIGSHLAETLVAAGCKVRILDNLSTGRLSNIADFANKVELVQDDIRDRDAVERAMEGCSHIMHLAAMVSVFDSVNQPWRNHDINLTGTLNILEAARMAGARRLVFASSCSVYGQETRMPVAESLHTVPVSPYALTKKAGETYAALYSQLYGLETVTLRFFNVYGPRQDPSSPYSGVISIFANEALKKGRPVIYGDGRQTRDFVCVDDVVRALVMAASGSGLGQGEVFNVGTGESSSLLDLLVALRRVTGEELKPVFRPAREGDVIHSRADVTQAQRLLKFAARVRVDQGLQTLWESLSDPEKESL